MAKAATKSTAPVFSNILDQPAGEFKAPVPLPSGTYLGVINGLPRRDKSKTKGTDFIEYNVKILEPYKNDDGETDVDLDEVKEMGGVKDKEMKLTFYFTEKSGFMHDEFLKEVAKVEPDGEKSSWDFAQELSGQQLLVFVKQEPRQDGKGMRSVIARTLPIPE